MNHRDTRVGVFAVLMGLTCGYDATAMAGALLLVTDYLGLTTTGQGSLYSATAAGWIAGALPAGRLVGAIGRRRTLFGLVGLYLVGTAVAVSAGGLVWLDIGRFVQGTAIGVAIVATPVFIAESASTRVRGRIAVLYQVATSLGCALGYFGGYFLAGGGQWRLMLAIPGVLALVAAAGLVPLPETDRWRRDAPRPALRALVGARHRRLTFFVVALGFFVQATGINAMVFFSPRIFERMGYADAFGLLVLPGFVQLAGAVAALACALTVDRFGRRPALLTGTALMALGHAVMVVVFAADSPGVVGFVGLVVFVVGFNSGFGALVWVFAAEGYPDHLRGAGASAMLLTNLTTNLVVAQFFLDLLGAVGGTGTYLLLLGVTAAAWLFVFFLAPETKGRSLDEVQAHWEGAAGAAAR
ncbi:Arabinose-proton symporter [Actinosynnema sp. ALI-1.44]